MVAYNWGQLERLAQDQDDWRVTYAPAGVTGNGDDVTDDGISILCSVGLAYCLGNIAAAGVVKDMDENQDVGKR